MNPLRPVILCGGIGARLAPHSTPERPKQFMEMQYSPGTLFGQTVARARRLCPGAGLRIVTTAALEPQARALCPAGSVPDEWIIEPLRRNTAAAIALAAHRAAPDDLLWIMPCDHVIGDEAALAQALEAGRAQAFAGRIVLLGIRPDRAHTGYGYIRHAPGGRVLAFLEKPDEAAARSLIAQGDCLWNSGMVMGRAQTLLDACRAHAPVYAQASLERRYPALPSLPFDKAVLEHTDNAIVIPCAMGWQDIGTPDSAAAVLSGFSNVV